MAAAEGGGRMDKIASVQRQRQRQRQRRPVRLKARAAFDAMNYLLSAKEGFASVARPKREG